MTSPEIGGPEGAAREFARDLVDVLHDIGVRNAWGVCGREIVPLWSALLASRITTRHARHETGAGFMAIGDWLQSGRPNAIFTTTGPGVTNVLTSLESARATGAPLILLTPLTPTADTGRLGIQETGPTGYFNDRLDTPGPLFDLVAQPQTPDELPALAAALAAGYARRPSFTAHIAIPTTLQSAPVTAAPVVVEPVTTLAGAAPAAAQVDALVALLAAERVALLVGFGARKHAAAVRRFVERTGVPVMNSPRGLGVADTCSTFIGVTGNGGHEAVGEELIRYGVERILVLGSRLGEPTSGWEPTLVAPNGFVHVDRDPAAFARAYPHVPVMRVEADLGLTLEALLASRLPKRSFTPSRPPRPDLTVAAERRAGVVHPLALVRALQRAIVDGTSIPVFADASSAMFWGAHHLAFPTPDRWFTEQLWGSMGFAGAAVVGAAAARGGPALALSGDGALHMQCELNTAVRYGIPAIWVVLNDSGLGIVRHAMEANRRPDHDTWYAETDFAAIARANGAEGMRVTREQDLEPALRAAAAAGVPFLVDVVTDPVPTPPIGARAKR